MNITRRAFIAAGAAGLAWPLPFARGSSDERQEEVDWLDEVQQPPSEAIAASDLPPLLETDSGAIATLAEWQERRKEISAAWLEFLQPLKSKREPPQLKVLEEDRPEGCIRQLVQYESEPGLPVEAYLLKPDRGDGPFPGVVVLHSTVPFTIRQPAGLEGAAEEHIGLKLAQRGVVAFCPRCFLWQGKESYQEQVAAFRRRHPDSKGMAKMLWDASRAVDALEQLPEVDSNRLGAAGHSLGAKETLYLAAFDERIKAAVSSEGGIGATFSNWEADWYLGPGIRDGSFTREHHELLALVAPRAFLLMGGNSADGDQSWPFVEAALPVYKLYGGRPRLGLFNHKKGHAIPPEAEQRLYEWLTTYL